MKVHKYLLEGTGFIFNNANTKVEKILSDNINYFI